MMTYVVLFIVDCLISLLLWRLTSQPRPSTSIPVQGRPLSAASLEHIGLTISNLSYDLMDVEDNAHRIVTYDGGAILSAVEVPLDGTIQIKVDITVKVRPR